MMPFYRLGPGKLHDFLQKRMKNLHWPISAPESGLVRVQKFHSALHKCGKLLASCWFMLSLVTTFPFGSVEYARAERAMPLMP
jgi:hypothetical protein